MNNDIEKKLFTEEEPSPKVETPDKTTEGKTQVQNDGQWTPQEIKSGISDDIWIKIIFGGIIVLSPLILLYELGESLHFKCSQKRRREEYRKMVKERARKARKCVPEMDDSGFFRNADRCVVHCSTNEDIYPECYLSLWVPEDKAGNYPRVPWMQTIGLYSVKVPHVFHSIWADGRVSDLNEEDWLAEFQKRWNLSDAIVVINYKHYGDDNFYLRQRKLEMSVIDSFPFDDEDRPPLECYVELLLLTDKKPKEGLEWEKVEYRFFHLGTFTLERNFFNNIKDRKRLETMLADFGFDI